MLKASRNLLDKVYCFFVGHLRHEVMWPGYGNAPFRVFKCVHCGHVKYRQAFK